MAEILERSIRSNNVKKRYVRIAEAEKIYNLSEELMLHIAFAAGAIYQLPKIMLVNVNEVEVFMKHIYKVPNTGKYVQKKLVRIGEGSIIYSIGHHRFIEMARAAGAVYKINGSVFISLELFDDYLEQFREPVKEIKICNPREEK